MKEGASGASSHPRTWCVFAQAMKELEGEGGVEDRYRRFQANHRVLVDGMRQLGLTCLLPGQYQSPIITSFLSPAHHPYSFEGLYKALKARGFVIYPGKVTTADAFRFGNIGDLYPEDMYRLVDAVQDCMFWDPSHPHQGPGRSFVMA